MLQEEARRWLVVLEIVPYLEMKKPAMSGRDDSPDTIGATPHPLRGALHGLDEVEN